jgi:DNA-binding ferritin-like protein
MDKIDTLIAYLFAIQAFAKDIHYSVKGEAFYSKHLLADEIYKGIDEQIDSLVETCILPFMNPSPTEHYWDEAMQILKNIRETNFKNLLDLITETIRFINSNEFSKTKSSLIDDIGKDLQRKAGLITRQVG